MQSSNPQEEKLITTIEEIDSKLFGNRYPADSKESADYYNRMTGDAFDEYATAKGWTQPDKI